jgi:integrase
MSAHPAGQWVKKVRGKIRYFGEWANPDPDNAKAKAALAKWLDFMKATDNGTREPDAAPIAVVRPNELNLDTVVNGFLTEKITAMNAGELSPRQFTEYRKLGDLILKVLGKERLAQELTPADFAALRGKLPGGPVRLGNQIVWIRSFFRWAAENHGIAVRYGAQFEKPARRVVRKAVKKKEIFTADEIKKILENATPAITAMTLLGINAGFGQTDCATLPAAAVDLERGLIAFDRHKTGVSRLVPLWKETVRALKEYKHPSPTHPELFFVTRWGHAWVRDEVHNDAQGIAKKTVRCDAVDLEFDKAQKDAGMSPRGFYLLRHTFRTIADTTGDLNAIRAIMGHAFAGMDEFYLHLHAGGMDRLNKVVKHVHDWLYPPSIKPRTTRRSAGHQAAGEAAG